MLTTTMKQRQHNHQQQQQQLESSDYIARTIDANGDGFVLVVHLYRYMYVCYTPSYLHRSRV